MQNPDVRRCVLWAAMAVFAGSVRAAAVSFGAPFSHGAVLQSARPVPVWGKADAGAEVTVVFGSVSAGATADNKGGWRVTFAPLAVSSTPRTLEVKAKTRTGSVTSAVCTNVVVGEVWLCSGQSNMAQALVDPVQARYRDAIGAMVAQVTVKPLVRYMKAPGRLGWHALTPEFLSSRRRSALAVYYALELHDKLGIPIGVIEAAAGGSNIDNWQPTNGAKAGCHNTFMKELFPYALRGVFWYQGETNIYVGETDVYADKQKLLYESWRREFENDGLRFYYVQIAPFARGKLANGFDYDAEFPNFLVAQARLENTETNAAMTVINDLGNLRDIHPNEKLLVAKRTALHALKRDYGFDGIEDCSPKPRTITAVGARVRIEFDHAKALYVYRRNDRFRKEAPFELAGEDGEFKPAQIGNYLKFNSMSSGTITNNVIELTAEGVDRPKKVRYAWRIPWQGEVYNEVNLPLATFSAEVEAR